jgi:hypothetical protein
MTHHPKNSLTCYVAFSAVMEATKMHALVFILKYSCLMKGLQVNREQEIFLKSKEGWWFPTQNFKYACVGIFLMNHL